MRHYQLFPLVLAFAMTLSCTRPFECTPSDSDMVFPALSKVWDEAIPLGNANVGALVWQKGGSLRMSLDHYDLWDLRPTDEYDSSNPEFSYDWLKRIIREEQWDRT